MEFSIRLALLCMLSVLLTVGSAGALDAAPAEAASPEKITQRLNRAERLVDEGKRHKALEVLDEVLALEGVPPVQRQRALSARARARLAEADWILDHPSGDGASAGDPRRIAALEGAVRDLREIVVAGPPDGSLAVRERLITALFELERFDEVRRELDAYTERSIGPEPPELLTLRGCLQALEAMPEGQPIQPGSDDSAAGRFAYPKAVHRTAPHYTEEARRADFEGTVVGHVLVDATGRVACVKVLRGAPYGLAESYQSSFYDWRFQPAHLDGEPVAAWYWTTIRFRREMR